MLGERRPICATKSLTLVLAGALSRPVRVRKTIGAAKRKRRQMRRYLSGKLYDGADRRTDSNLMPCVPPVLGMKLGSILLVEEKPLSHQATILAGRRYHCVIYGAGGVYDPSFRAWSTMRWPGSPQFQNAWFIGFMALVMLLFSASLLAF